MALILCPECHNQISDKAEQCPYCGLPAKYFLQEPSVKQDMTALLKEKCDYKNLGNVLISFDQDYTQLFSAEHYITHRDAAKIQNTYQYYYETLKSKLVYQYVENHAGNLRVDILALQSFLRRMHTLKTDISSHNSAYVEPVSYTHLTLKLRFQSVRSQDALMS